MNADLVCPTCGKSFADQDYCPEDGAMLVVPTSTAAHSVRHPSIESQGDVSQAAPAVLFPSDPPPSVQRHLDDAGQTKLAGFMKRLGLRRVTDKATLNKNRKMAACETDAMSPLPPELLEQGWRLAGPLQSSAALDRWPVQQLIEGSDPISGHFHRYRTGALTTASLYRRLERDPSPQLARIFAHGTVDFGGARADYDLVSSPQTSVALDRWLADGAASEGRAMYLLPALVQLLRQLAGGGIRPLIFEPAVLSRTAGGDLWLTSAAALGDVNAANEYHAEYARSALLPHGWAAPELTQQHMLSASAAVFSVGQLLARCTWGQPCSLSDLQTGAVPFETLADPRLARVLMGCLWPRAEGRWTLDKLIQASESDSAQDMPVTPPWESLTPGASSTAFSFAGASFWRLEDLLSAAVQPSNWTEATSRLQAILTWAEGTAWIGQVGLMRQALAARRSADWVLVALRRAVCPTAPLTWRSLDLSDAQAPHSLAGLAQRALREGNSADAATMRDLFAADLRGAFTSEPRKSRPMRQT